MNLNDSSAAKPTKPTTTRTPATKQRLPQKTPPSSDRLPVYNILLLGPTQAGKSTFIESVKQYADPSYVPNQARIGNGNESHTQDLHWEVVTTCLPIYKLHDLEDDCEIEISRYLAESTEKPFKKLLFRDDDLELWPDVIPGSTFVQFKLFDTPGLDDTNGNDIQNIARTFTGLYNVNEFHMVLIMDSHEVPLTMSQKAAFRSYFDLFEDLKSLITIVHTKVPNIHRHPANTKLESRLAGRSQFFNEIMGRTVPTKRIDCDVDETGPAHMCLTRNTIREILEIATIKTPVTRNRAHVYKAVTMSTIDKIVHAKYKAKLDSVVKSCDALGKADQLAIKIENTRNKIRKIERQVDDHDTDDLIPLFEERFDEEWTLFGWRKDQTMRFPNQEYTINQVRVAKHSMDLLHEAGGEGHKFWEVRFKRECFHSGYYHVVLSMTTRTKYRKDIDGWRSDLLDLSKTLEREIKEHLSQSAIVQQNANGSSDKLEQLKGKMRKYEKMLDFTSSLRLTLDEFLELANADIYKGTDIAHNADALENHLANKFGIEWSERS